MDTLVRAFVALRPDQQERVYGLTVELKAATERVTAIVDEITRVLDGATERAKPPPQRDVH